jgi:hypothetical protein
MPEREYYNPFWNLAERKRKNCRDIQDFLLSNTVLETGTLWHDSPLVNYNNSPMELSPIY